MPRRLAIGDAQDLAQAERDIRAGTGDQELNFAAMAAVSNIYRAANAIRHHMEQRVLAEEDLSWAAFTVLFVLWIWGDQQTRHLAAEAGVTKGALTGVPKGTLTGVLKTLEKRSLARAPRARRGRPAGARLAGTPGPRRHRAAVPRVQRGRGGGQRQPERAGASVSEREKNQLATLLRKIIRTVEDED